MASRRRVPRTRGRRVMPSCASSDTGRADRDLTLQGLNERSHLAPVRGLASLLPLTRARGQTWESQRAGVCGGASRSLPCLRCTRCWYSCLPFEGKLPIPSLQQSTSSARLFSRQRLPPPRAPRAANSRKPLSGSSGQRLRESRCQPCHPLARRAQRSIGPQRPPVRLPPQRKARRRAHSVESPGLTLNRNLCARRPFTKPGSRTRTFSVTRLFG
jgi:hypothetical protein